MAKLNTRVGIESEPVHPRNLGCNLPDLCRQDLAAGSLGRYAEPLAGGDPHAAHGIKDNLCHIRRRSVKDCVMALFMNRLLHPRKVGANHD